MGAIVATAPAPAFASPDAPMCVADGPHVTAAPIELVRWKMPMCGPFAGPIAVMPEEPTTERAIDAYKKASTEILAANYEEARLQLDLARRGLSRIADRIALQSGRLELLRQRPDRAAEFFAEAMESPHQSVRVEAAYGHVFARIRRDDPTAGEALADLLATYPQIPHRAEILFEHARSLVRQRLLPEAISIMHELRVQFPSAPSADWANAEIARLQAAGHEVPAMTDAERIEQARQLITHGPLDEAEVAIHALLEMPFTDEQQAEVHYLAGKLARFEGRWEAAETYMRTAQLFPTEDSLTARAIASRARDMAETASARDRDEALARLSTLRAGRKDATIPTSQLLEMLEVASAASLTNEVDTLVDALVNRRSLRPRLLFEAAMAAAGSASGSVLVRALETVAKSCRPRDRVPALYHLARAYERAGRTQEAELFFNQARAAAEDDPYYALWAENGLRRLVSGEPSGAMEGVDERLVTSATPTPPASNAALAARLESIAKVHADSYPWIARAVDLLRVDERDAATEELFEAYLRWREAQGRPVARAGLDCVARADGRPVEPVASDVREARLDLSVQERETLSTVAASLGDVGTAGGFAGPDFLDTLPRAYEWLVTPAAQRYGIDPNLLLAVMRVESAYQKHIVSYAGAVGLMQIMPRTGQLIAHALDRNGFSPADLLDPRVNVEFAAWYLSSLLNRFDGRLPLAIAAYNGGPHNVRRWIQESAEQTPLDVLLERIPFTQTHRYVRKVLVHYEAYRRQRALSMPPLSVVLPEPRVDPLAF